MSDIFILDDELSTTAGLDASPTESATGWQPGQRFTAPSNSPAVPPAAPAVPATKATTKKTKRGEPADEMPYKPLPEPKPEKKLSPREKAKVEKAQLIKEREADAAAMRINGVDGDVEIPKKAFLTDFTGKRARPDEVAETLTDLASSLESGESERKSVNELAIQYGSYDIGQAYERVVMLLDRGVTLSAAMADQTDTFPAVVRELIGAAKMPKDMHRNLRQAAIIIVEADNIKSKVKGALFQPGFMLFLLVIFVIAAVQFLLPMTTQMFTGIGAKAPATTLLIIAIGGWLKWILGALVVLSFLASACWKLFLKNNERLAIAMDTFSLKAPLVGEIMRMSTAARFCDVLGACLAVGMSELEALETSARACGNKALQAWVDEHVGRQRFGIVKFADVAKTEMLPYNLRNRIETTTSLTRRVEILRELAETFHHKSKERLNRFADRVGPITTAIVVGVVIAVVLLIISPIMTFIPTLLSTIGGH